MNHVALHLLYLFYLPPETDMTNLTAARAARDAATAVYEQAMETYRLASQQALTADLLYAVRDHAVANYELDGWDVVIECYDDADIIKIIGDARTTFSAITKVRAHVAPYAVVRDDIRAA
jgi:hypothetical protein